MPFFPPLFGDIGKSLKKLLEKSFNDEKDKKLFTGSVLKFSTKNGEGVQINSYTRHKGDEILSEISAKYSGEPANISLTLDNKSSIKLTGSTTKLYDGLEAELSLKYGKKKGAVGGLNLTYQKDFVKCALDISAVKSGENAGINNELCASIGEDYLSVGGSYPISLSPDLKLNAMKFDDLSIGVAWNLKDLSCTLINKPDNEVKMGFLQKMSGSTTLGAEYHVKGLDKTPKLTFGLQHKVSPELTVNGALASTGTLSGKLTQKFKEPNLTAALTFGMDLTKGYDLIQPVGVTVSLGDA
eukprot:CAMPEP_0167758426 /NCGR_PEP_ID=MMETSP0110_2-20121227/10460_1 /TAXON_ID=629695 /ORGANISM="Gymnochlora sp., Strain CCMP2014" /LENGTH=297 /DNA_ID=CAMNT_0007644697 /DNA_START=73 /DNA_END=966 /DNA_ORIENTATION=-